MKKTVFVILICVLTGLISSGLWAEPKDLSNEACMECHGDSSIEPVSERGAQKNLHVDGNLYREGAHSEMQCIECHYQEDCPEVFDRSVETLASIERRGCIDCHGKYFQDKEIAFQESVHHKEIGEPFGCSSCHDQHTVPPTLTESNIIFYDVHDRIRSDNTQCLSCHDKAERYSQFSDDPMPDIRVGHAFLPNPERHWDSVRCVDCHTPYQEMAYHKILSRKESRHNCIQCHNAKSMLTQKLYREPLVEDNFKFIGSGFFQEDGLKKRYQSAGFDIANIIQRQNQQKPDKAADSDEHFLNKYLFDSAYVIGATRNTRVDFLIGLVVGITALAVILHGVIRMLTSPMRKGNGGREETTYLYSKPTRYWHWLNALLFIVLIVTGFNMHFADIDNAWLSFELSVTFHNAAALLVIIGYLFYLAASVVNGNIKNYLPHFRQFFTKLYRQTRFYLFDIFLGRPHPYPAEKGNKFNPLQKAAYVFVMFILFPILIGSGIVMYLPALAPKELMGYPGIYPIAMVHYGAAVLFVMFLMVHLYLSTTDRKSVV